MSSASRDSCASSLYHLRTLPNRDRQGVGAFRFFTDPLLEGIALTEKKAGMGFHARERKEFVSREQPARTNLYSFEDPAIPDRTVSEVNRK